jgi:PAS domain-containing protein
MAENNSTGYDPGFEVLSQLFDAQPDAVIWYIPKFSAAGDDIPVDFKIGYCNNATSIFLRVSKYALTGETLMTSPLIDDETRQNIFDQCNQVWKTNVNEEFTYFVPIVNKHFCAQRSKLRDGILSITRDHTKFVEQNNERERQSRLLNQIIESSPNGICLYESIRNKNGRITDFRLRLANEKSCEITAFTMEELQKYTVKELMVLRAQSNLFPTLVNVVDTGAPVYTEYFAEARQQWIAFSITKFEDGYLLNYSDITERKKLERRAQDQAELLTGILNASITGLMSLEAIISDDEIEDFRFLTLNSAAMELLGLNEEARLKTYLGIFPAAKTNGFIDLYKKVLITGESVTKEIFYKGEGYNGWYYISVSRMNETTLVQTFSDITHTRLK